MLSADVVDVDAAGARLHGERERVAQAAGPDRACQAALRCVKNGLSVGIDAVVVEAQHLAERVVQVWRPARRWRCRRRRRRACRRRRSACAPPLWLVAPDSAGRLTMLQLAACAATSPLAVKRLMRLCVPPDVRGVVDVDEAVAREVRMQRDAEQAAFAARIDRQRQRTASPAARRSCTHAQRAALLRDRRGARRAPARKRSRWTGRSRSSCCA